MELAGLRSALCSFFKSCKRNMWPCEEEERPNFRAKICLEAMICLVNIFLIRRIKLCFLWAYQMNTQLALVRQSILLEDLHYNLLKHPMCLRQNQFSSTDALVHCAIRISVEGWRQLGSKRLRGYWFGSEIWCSQGHHFEVLGCWVLQSAVFVVCKRQFGNCFKI